MAGRRAAIDARIIAPGALLFPAAIALDEQRGLVAQCEALVEGPVPAYVPVVRGGGRMHVRMLCLGRHWNGQRYSYEDARTDYDGQPAPAIPRNFTELARRFAERAGMPLDPDVCILNFYDRDGRMGLHVDKDESAASLASGCPVVSISLGDAASFCFGGLRRRDPVETLELRSGDVFVFGGEARLRYHGIARTFPGTAPVELAFQGRFNLTFRRY
jgi:alkylated DNA repair protein (DNA oxidative demethylase)